MGHPQPGLKSQKGVRGGRLGRFHPGIREGFLEEVAWEVSLDGLVELVRGRAG